jgi:hypothetical protein
MADNHLTGMPLSVTETASASDAITTGYVCSCDDDDSGGDVGYHCRGA